MRRPAKFCVGVLLMVALLALVLPTAVMAEEGSIEMMVSPNVLAINSNGGSVSIHADISYYQVVLNETTLTVNDEPLEILYMFHDDRGDLVVKCSIATLKGMVAGESSANFVLTVPTKDGDVFTGIDEIGIASPKGK